MKSKGNKFEWNLEKKYIKTMRKLPEINNYFYHNIKYIFYWLDNLCTTSHK